MNKRNSLFHKTVRETLKQIKQEEQIGQHEIDASWKAVEEILSGTPQPARRTSFWKHWAIAGSVAASVLLFVSLAVWQMNPTTEVVATQQNHIIVPEGRNKQFTLADGTKIHVKANSHVIYPSVFAKDHREITLVKGEAYLEVAHNPQAPFTVKTNDFDVKVLGTHFNVAIAENGKPASVVLVEGSVEVESIRKEKALLSPNQRADISANGIQLAHVDVQKYICWKDHIILLEGDQLGSILEQLSSFYGVDIQCDKTINNFSLSGKLDLNESVEKTIRILKLSTGFDYKKEKDGFYIYKK